MTGHYGRRSSTTGSSGSRANSRAKFPFSLDNLETRGPHLFDLFKIFLPHVVGLKVWKYNTTGRSTRSYRKIVNVLDEGFLLLILMNNVELWEWEWNKKDGRLSDEEKLDPPLRKFTIRTKGETREKNPTGKGVKNTGWSDEGKKRLKEMAQEFHGLRKDFPEHEDPLDIRMNEYLEDMRSKMGRKTLSSKVEEHNAKEGQCEPEENADGFMLCDLDGFEGGVEEV